MDSMLKTLIDARERINAASPDERIGGIRNLVAVVNRIQSLHPEDQVTALAEARHYVQGLGERMRAVTAEYEEAHAWLKVLEGVVRQGDVIPVSAGDDPDGTPPDATVASPLADAPGTGRAEA